MHRFTATKTVRLKVLLATVFALVLLLAPPALAGNQGEPTHWWAGLDLGAGRLRQTNSRVFDDATTCFFMGLSGGVAVTPQLLVGAELSGWLIRSGDLYGLDQGAGITQVFVTSRIYPSKMSSFHVRLGGGYVERFESIFYSSGGAGWEIGVGYDMKVGRRFYLTPFVAYYSTKIRYMDQSEVTGGLGFVWR